MVTSEVVRVLKAPNFRVSWFLATCYQLLFAAVTAVAWILRTIQLCVESLLALCGSRSMTSVGKLPSLQDDDCIQHCLETMTVDTFAKADIVQYGSFQTNTVYVIIPGNPG